jgi:hypothetical protein
MGFLALRDPRPMAGLASQQADFTIRQKRTMMVAHPGKPLSLLPAVQVLGGETVMAIRLVVASEAQVNRVMEADSGNRETIKATPTLITSRDLSVVAGRLDKGLRTLLR